jgi:hypothetical protein
MAESWPEIVGRARLMRAPVHKDGRFSAFFPKLLLSVKYAGICRLTQWVGKDVAGE